LPHGNFRDQLIPAPLKHVSSFCIWFGFWDFRDQLIPAPLKPNIGIGWLSGPRRFPGSIDRGRPKEDLCAQNVIREPILYLSLYFKTHRTAYYDLLDRVRAKGDWEAWLDFFLNGVKDTAEQAASAARRIVALFEDNQRRIEALGRPAASVLRVFRHMQRNRIVSVPATARKTGISAPTVAKSLEHMGHLGIVREITGRERHRLFCLRTVLGDSERRNGTDSMSTQTSAQPPDVANPAPGLKPRLQAKACSTRIGFRRVSDPAPDSPAIGNRSGPGF
jgi:hypothetical protein